MSVVSAVAIGCDDCQVALTSERDVVVVLGGLDRLDVSTNVELLDLVVEVGGGGVSNIIGTQDLLGLERLVGLVDVGDWALAGIHRYRKVSRTGNDGEGSLVSGVSESDLDARGEAESVNVLLRDIEGDGHGEQGALSLSVDLGQSKGVSNAADQYISHAKRMGNGGDSVDHIRGVVLLVHETFERRETTVHDELQVTELSLETVSEGFITSLSGVSPR